MSVKPLYERLDIDDILQTITSNYPGSKIYTQFDVDSNEFDVLIEYLEQTTRLKFDISEIEHRYGMVGLTSRINNILEKMELDGGCSIDTTSDSVFKRLFDICKTYDVSVNIRPTTVSDDICCVRVLKDKQALDYLIDLDEITQSKIPMDEGFITRIDMAAKELSKNIHGFDLGSVSELTIKEENI